MSERPKDWASEGASDRIWAISAISLIMIKTFTWAQTNCRAGGTTDLFSLACLKHFFWDFFCLLSVFFLILHYILSPHRFPTQTSFNRSIAPFFSPPIRSHSMQKANISNSFNTTQIANLSWIQIKFCIILCYRKKTFSNSY